LGLRDLPSVVADVLTDPEGAKNLAGNCPPPDSGPLGDAEFGKKPANLSKQFAESTNRWFQFQKRRQLFIHVHNETLSVVAGRVCRPDRSPFGAVSSAWSQALYCECLYDDDLIEEPRTKT